MCREGSLDDVRLEWPTEMYLGRRQLGWRSGREGQEVDGKTEEKRRQRMGGRWEVDKNQAHPGSLFLT
jgi:hypothetical protein